MPAVRSIELRRDAAARKRCTLAIEPLLADLQHELAATTSRPRRLRLRVRGYSAFWLTLAICATQSIGLTVRRATFDQRLVAVYVVAITLVVLFAPHWVRTGTLSLTAAADTLTRLTMLPPLIVLYRRSGSGRGVKPLDSCSRSPRARRSPAG